MLSFMKHAARTRIGAGACQLVYAACAAVLVSCGGSSGSPPSSPELSTLDLFDQVWEDFDLHYSFFVLKGIDWDASRQRFRPQLTSASSERELFDVLSEMLLELEDGHVRLSTPLGTSVYRGWHEDFPSNNDSAIVSATYLGETERMSPEANLTFGRIDDDIGYLAVRNLAGSGYGPDTDYVLAQLSSVRAMILDLRDNSGGDDRNGKAVVARFADTIRLIRQVRYRNGPAHDDFGPPQDDFIEPDGTQSFDGPVAVLTNRRVFSSAETMVLALDVLPNVVRIGDFTGGGSANPMRFVLPNGWSYMVSRWIVNRPDGTTFEGIGIEPDIRIDITEEDAASLRDTIMEEAISDLRHRLQT
jgi:hypothetical protein